MDTIGRHELLGLQAVTGYDSGCPVCYHEWSSGLTGTQCCFDGYRRFLPERSPGRQARVTFGGLTYQYAQPETRRPPDYRSGKAARECLTVVDVIGVDACRGHKYPPLLAQLPGFNWRRLNPPELMHDSKVLVEMLLKVLVGKVSGGGVYESWSQDSQHRKQNQIRGIFPTTWPQVGGPFPWRLTRDQRMMLDQRMGNLIWPARVEKLFYIYNGASFWTKPSRMWKAIRKFTLLYFILPNQLSQISFA